MTKGRHLFWICLSVLLLSLTDPSFGQLGGRYTYGLLNLNTATRSGSLGGSAIAVPDPDVGLVNENPAYLGLGLHNQLSLSYVNYFADINYGRVAYGYQTSKWGSFSAGLFYLNYGDFIEANEFGDITGEFNAAEYSFDLGWGYALDSTIFIGVNIKPIYSVFERYQSWGISGDAAVLYLTRNKLTAASLVIRNMGTQLSTYHSPQTEPLPFEIMAGVSQKIKYAPFRLSLTLRNLQKFDIDVIQPDAEVDPATGEKIYENSFQELAAKSFDHVVAAVEFIPGSAVSIRLGYNFRNRAELKLGTRNTASGLTFGLGLNLGKFKIDYGLANYHVAGISHLFSFSTDFSRLL